MWWGEVVKNRNKQFGVSKVTKVHTIQAPAGRCLMQYQVQATKLVPSIGAILTIVTSQGWQNALHAEKQTSPLYVHG